MQTPLGVRAAREWFQERFSEQPGNALQYVLDETASGGNVLVTAGSQVFGFLDSGISGFLDVVVFVFFDFLIF